MGAANMPHASHTPFPSVCVHPPVAQTRTWKLLGASWRTASHGVENSLWAFATGRVAEAVKQVSESVAAAAREHNSPTGLTAAVAAAAAAAAAAANAASRLGRSVAARQRLHEQTLPTHTKPAQLPQRSPKQSSPAPLKPESQRHPTNLHLRAAPSGPRLRSPGDEGGVGRQRAPGPAQAAQRTVLAVVDGPRNHVDGHCRWGAACDR